ncbi:MAG: hypothetical protein O3A63_13200 [Proteobacteria bacterium]|nr:hypothetical protein [Pseudomonadota bacterium]
MTAASGGLTAGVEIGGGVGGGVGGLSCDDVKRQITRDWFEMKKFFRPDETDMKRPKSREFYCVSPGYTHSAMPKVTASMSLSCFTVQGSKFCCNKSLETCAGL